MRISMTSSILSHKVFTEVEEVVPLSNEDKLNRFLTQTRSWSSYMAVGVSFDYVSRVEEPQLSPI